MKQGRPENRPQPRQKPSLQEMIEAAVQRIRALHAQGRYQEALDICLQITRADPNYAAAWSHAAGNCIHLYRWQDAVTYAQTALACGGNTVVLYDALAHAHGKLGQWDEAGRCGLLALNMRDSQFNVEPVIPWPEPELPPPPSAATRERNIIAFSLFGGDPKYCDSAILNVLEQPAIYPHWICRFYVDSSVPQGVLEQLRLGGAQVIPVDGGAAGWPGPMWRFLALDDCQAHRILFRDADSLISPREAGAMAQWLASGKRFHMMRDAGSHTELMMAGMWGAVAGSLPPLEQLMQRFMGQPLQSEHFADQFFLRQYVWPYARASLMQHDSVFGFMDGVPFPDGPRADGCFVGDSPAVLTFPIDRPNATQLSCDLLRIETPNNAQQSSEKLVYSFATTVHNGSMKLLIPSRYVRMLQQGTARLSLNTNKTA
jgi:hypothetical protein